METLEVKKDKDIEGKTKSQEIIRISRFTGSISFRKSGNVFSDIPAVPLCRSMMPCTTTSKK